MTVRDLGKRFGDRWIFRGISFSLDKGDRLVILGRNGAGKSTLLRCLAGLAEPSHGDVLLPGDARVSVGYAALGQALYPQLMVDEHLELTGDLRGCPARTDELLEFVDLAYAKKEPAANLSSGMRARLRFAMAIQARPPVLMLDEPGASLDEEGRRLVERICEDQASRGCLILATNEPAERRLANLELEL